jgi:prepilin-type N-terminal cleavage/methylation domain-containing protein
VPHHTKTGWRFTSRRQRGFSLLEMLVAIVLLMGVAGIAMTGMVQMTRTQGTLWNRTEMHSGVRSATELLQQEIGQAGRISLPGTVTLSAAVPATGSHTVTVSSAAGMFTGEQLVIDTGANQETVALTDVASTGNQITAVFNNTHASGAPVSVQGGFASGIVPTTMTNGSTGSLLKLYGDINADGTMVYVEYKCDTTVGYLYRNVMAFDAASKPAVTSAKVLLNNVQPNPGGTACFTYQQKTVGADTYVLDVAITLTVQTQEKDPQTNQYQKETKALLNVSPRNVFDIWELASGGATNRIQPMPASVTTLLP